MLVEIEQLKQRNIRIFEAVGLSRKNAEIITEVLTQTEMRGVFTHGYYRVPRYVHCIKSGGIRPECRLTVESDTPSWAMCDGNGGLGIVLAYKATELAISKALNTGVGIVNLKNSHHFGAAGYYTGMCAEKGMIGLAMSNGDVLVAATGSAEKTIGNNPFSFASPAGKYGKIIYDIAMSYTSDQKVIKAAKDGVPLPDGWLIDKDGNQTNDAKQYELGGTLLPFGGYKGYGLAMMVEVLAAALSGSAMTKNVHAWNDIEGKSGNVGHFFIALDVKKMVSADCFEKRVENMIDEIKSSRKAKNINTIYFPGEIENIKYRGCSEKGLIEINDQTMLAFAQTEKDLNIL